jgi:hypothetical protein
VFKFSNCLLVNQTPVVTRLQYIGSRTNKFWVCS